MTAKNKHTKPVPPDPAAAVVGEAAGTPESAAINSISVEELENLKARAAKADENWDKFLRTAAELDNYRKRVAREKEELARYTSERVVSALLPVLDNLERAIDAAQKHGADNASLLDGITQVYSQFRRSLGEFGLQDVIANAGHPFDPNLHEAVSHIESGEHLEGHVVEQLQRGYKLADRLLRPARVVVSKGSPDVTGQTAAETDMPPENSE
jgi:molecular chaperone GrpE